MAGSVSIVMVYMATLAHAEQNFAQRGEKNMQRRNNGGPSIDFQYYDALQMDYAHYMLFAMASTVALYFIWKSSLRLTSHIRRLYGIGKENQRYFALADHRMAWLKRHLVDAPLFRTRHNREFQLFKGVNMGTLPNRFQAICLAGLVAMNVSLSVLHIPFSEGLQTFSNVFKNRLGTLAVVNLIPLVILAGRNNPLIPLLGLSFDNWNFFHRWLARIVVLEAITHMSVWLIAKVDESGWAAVAAEFRESQQIITGLISIIGFVSLGITASSPLRHAFYETFLHFHILLVVMAFIALWYHLNTQSQQKYLLAALIFWVLERIVRLATNFFRNLVGGRTTAKIEALPGDATRVTLKLAQPWTVRPGQHAYICIPSIGLWTYHPFSVAWSEKEQALTDEKDLGVIQRDVIFKQKESISFLVRRRTGFTDSLFKRASKGVDGNAYVAAFVEGPYGGIHDLDSYGSVLLFAGGVGITHHIPFIRHLVKGYADGTVAARRVTLIWSIQSPEHLEWVRPWMTTILAMDRRRELLRIMLFVTRPRSTNEIRNPSTTVEMLAGRPDIQTLVDKEIEQQIGAMGVMVCGSGSLSDDVRHACRQRQEITNIDFIEESFTW